MQKLLFGVVTFLFGLMFVASVSAQEQQAQRWVCLDTERAAVHSARIFAARTGQKPLPNKDKTYLAVCIEGICTTGNATLDGEAFKKNNLAELGAKFGFQFQGLQPATNPVTTDANGEFPAAVWTDYTPQERSRIWMAMQYYTPGDAATGQQGGQQQGTFDWATASKKCVAIHWDPYGIVFDSQTLEPIKGAKVTLLFNKNGTGLFVPMTPADLGTGGTITNPQTTLEDGWYNFLVPNGDYKLTVESTTGPVTTLAEVHPQFTKAYSQLYPVQTGEIIREAGVQEHRDVPLVTQSYVAAEVTKMEDNTIPVDGSVFIQQRVTHPLTYVAIKTKKVYRDEAKPEEPYRTLTTITADKTGRFSYTVNQAQFEVDPNGEYVEMLAGVEYTKNTLTLAYGQIKQSPIGFLKRLPELILGTVFAQVKKTFVAIDSFPAYIEGYAYDAAGKPIPNAQVGVYVGSATQPVYVTVANEKGYYAIGSDKLPPLKYELRYTSRNGVVTKTTPAKFIKQNIAFAIENKVALFSPKTVVASTDSATVTRGAGVTGVDPTTTPPRQTGGGRVNTTGNPSQDGMDGSTNTPGSGMQTQGIVMIVVILLVLVGIGAGAVIAMKNRQQHQTFM